MSIQCPRNSQKSFNYYTQDFDATPSSPVNEDVHLSQELPEDKEPFLSEKNTSSASRFAVQILENQLPSSQPSKKRKLPEVKVIEVEEGSAFFQKLVEKQASNELERHDGRVYLEQKDARLIEDKLTSALQRACIQENERESNKKFIECMKSESVSIAKDSLVEKLENSVIDCTIGSTQGKRPTMEDHYLVSEIIVKDGSNSIKVPFLAIFDGHGGDEVAVAAKTKLPSYIKSALAEFNPQKLTEQGIWNALKIAFVRCGKELSSFKAGTTAIVVLEFAERVVTANLGDSRAIFFTPKEHLNKSESSVARFKSLSEDHKPQDPKFKKSIENRGGEVKKPKGMNTERLEGILSCARGFGNSKIGYKLCCRPTITSVPKEKGYILIASDGLFSPEKIKISNKDVAESFCSNLHLGLDESSIIKKTLGAVWTLSESFGPQTPDNTTIILYYIS